MEFGFLTGGELGESGTGTLIGSPGRDPPLYMTAWRPHIS